MNIELTGRKAIICGSTQGMGRAAAKEMASMGATVTLVARNEESLTIVRDSLGDGDHQAVCADFGEPTILEERINAHMERHGPFHILVNNTGGPPPGKIADATSNDFLEAFSKHLLCNQIMVKAVLPGMKSEEYGRIINIISTSVKQPIVNLGVSNTTRGAVASWAKTLSREVAPFGITVNNILPGFTDTDRLSSLIQEISKSEGKSEDVITEHMKQQVPTGRFGSPQETAKAIAFLASKAAGYINGVSLAVDGGRLSSI